jgi:tetratricopeptide (TPR) repeat protein
MKALSPGLEQRWRDAGEMERAVINLPPPPVGAATNLGPLPAVSVGTPATPSRPGTPPAQPGQPIQPNIPATTGTTGPGGPHITAALGFLNSGQIEAAYSAVQQAYRVEPNNSLVHRIFGQVFARRQPPMIDPALKAYATSLQLNPNDAETHKLIGDLWLFLRRQPAQAIPEYTQSLRLNPNDVEAHQRLGQCYEETNQLEAALREFQEAARLAGKQPALYYKVGQLATRLNQFPAAERAYVQILTLNAADHQARFLLSQVYESEGRLEDAWRQCNFVIGPLANNPAVQALYQRLRTRLGR